MANKDNETLDTWNPIENMHYLIEERRKKFISQQLANRAAALAEIDLGVDI